MSNQLTPMQEAINIVEKITKNLTDENQIKDLKAIANQFKTELLPKEQQVIEDAVNDTQIELIEKNIPELGKNYYKTKFKNNGK